MIQIFKGIPIPPSRALKYPWDTMKVNECFIFTSIRGHEAVYDANKKYSPKVFTSRKEKDYFRIWRVK